MGTKALFTNAWIAGLVMGAAAGAAFAQQPPPPPFDMGKTEYESHCAVCHGIDGRGNGPYKPFLTKVPTDLTVLSRANNGVFPNQKVYETIDGRLDVAAHGPREMPVWGADYRTEGMSQPHLAYQPEAFVRARIIALVEYIHRLQAK
jgi:mono/diheme cytochrome c family protein